MRWSRFPKLKFSIFLFGFLIITPLRAEINVLSNVDLSPWSKFGEAIQECTPGTFEVPNVLFLSVLKMMLTKMQTDSQFELDSAAKEELEKGIKQATLSYQILGFDGNMCKLTIIDNNPRSKATANCEIAKENLHLLAEQAFSNASGGEKPFTGETGLKCEKASNEQSMGQIIEKSVE